MKTDVAVLTFLALFASGAFGQMSASGTVSATGFRGRAHFGPPPPFGIRPVTGAPYSGEELSESVQTLADGTHVTRTMPGIRVYRDSQGRTRTERSMFMGPVEMRSNSPESPMIVEIMDPVEHARYVLDVQNRVAHRQELPTASPGMPPAAAIGSRPASGLIGASGGGGGGSRTSAAARGGDFARPQMTYEKLGTQTIDGVLVDGTRRTMRWPAGSEGNDRPITSVTETWTSPDLQVVILSKTTDPRSGEHTRKLINLSRSEPDPSLFQPPPGYTIVDEKSDFSINWGSQQQ